MPSFASQLIARARKTKSKSQHARDVRSFIDQLESAIREFDYFVSKTRANTELTAAGQAVAIRRFAEGGLIPRVRETERAIDQAKKLLLLTSKKSAGPPMTRPMLSPPCNALSYAATSQASRPPHDK